MYTREGYLVPHSWHSAAAMQAAEDGVQPQRLATRQHAEEVGAGVATVGAVVGETVMGLSVGHGEPRFVPTVPSGCAAAQGKHRAAHPDCRRYTSEITVAPSSRSVQSESIHRSAGLGSSETLPSQRFEHTQCTSLLLSAPASPTAGG